MLPANMPLWYIDYFEPKLLEKPQIQEEAFSEFPDLPKNKYFKRNSIFINPLYGNFIKHGRLTFLKTFFAVIIFNCIIEV